jgi:demethylmenaquinone methyltransferase/2-methoxy-6-polyprenyl-1,4-benzoquinol methylase
VPSPRIRRGCAAAGIVVSSPLMDRSSAQELRREPRRVAAMFDRIAARYDLMNALMTAGLDRRWRRLAATQAGLRPADEALDVCCGTGDLSIALAATDAGVRVLGLDLSDAMLDRARAKLASRAAAEPSLAARVGFVSGDALQLPFADGRFAAVTAAFGVRNLHDLSLAFAGLLRVTRPGGRLVCLEITTPPPGPGRRFHAFWFERCVPLLGRLVAGDGSAYSYLPASVRAFPDADGLARLLRDAGWRNVRYRRLGMGIVALHVAEKPAAGQPPAIAAEAIVTTAATETAATAATSPAGAATRTGGALQGPTP